ncbi:hypothetical protein IVB41_10600 [Bradyrhizobium sp. 44]|uniref:hypothetical protein n=1 Tax=Bradyrhizobium sp. 44 TaxID=2782675 RepID=UPI001FFACB30|nr:hypothetical protein [Bradyrhizobium sp. 44]MCK1284363.1 hypothetical protein [Bradyrhizobium sp. 44]
MLLVIVSVNKCSCLKSFRSVNCIASTIGFIATVQFITPIIGTLMLEHVGATHQLDVARIRLIFQVVGLGGHAAEI